LSYGFGESYLHAVVRDIYTRVKSVNPEAAVSLACLNPLFGPVFDMARMGNCSEVNHEVHCARAHTASWLLGDKPIDTDDWASYQKMVGGLTFVKAVAGMPGIFSAWRRGDGRMRFRGAVGGSPVRMPPDLYNVIATCWALYGFSAAIDRRCLTIDFDRGAFSTRLGDNASRVAALYGGNVLCVQTAGAVWASSLLDMRIVIELPFPAARASIRHVSLGGSSENIAFTSVADTNVCFGAVSCRTAPGYYHITRGET
jgi:hypothetical protein